MSRPSRQATCQELDATKATFRCLVERMTADDLKRPSNGTRWTNRELLYHMLFGYFVVHTLIPLVKTFGFLPRPVSRAFAAMLNAATAPFHPVNYFGSWIGGRLVSPAFMVRRLDRACDKLARRLAKESERSLDRGMHMPTKWDPFFKPYMTLREVYHYPTQHFYFHQQQLALNEAP